jgi:hypothetical protein
MRRLCTESACSYSGRAVRRAMSSGRVENQEGLLVDQGPGVPEGCWPGRANEAASAAGDRARRGAISGVNAQQSAEAILAAGALTRGSGSEGPNTNGQGGAVSDSTSTLNPTG